MKKGKPTQIIDNVEKIVSGPSETSPIQNKKIKEVRFKNCLKNGVLKVLSGFVIDITSDPRGGIFVDWKDGNYSFIPFSNISEIIEQ